MEVIEIKDLVKKYEDNIAVDNINLKIEEGEIYGVLGPNGAGKSTTISIICSLLHPTSGEIKVLGEDIRKNSLKVRRCLGLVPQNIAIYSDFTAYENVKFFGELYGLRGSELKEGIENSLEFTGLLEFKNKKAKDFSGGMLRRLNIA
ncbi:ATP-binding cassette domain-containing protein, partial [Clostridium perfringens]|nr:ATP-binding cassette domain-containing protein [Clostridium perfringens]